jgi:hypothetical protein
MRWWQFGEATANALKTFQVGVQQMLPVQGIRKGTSRMEQSICWTHHVLSPMCSSVLETRVVAAITNSKRSAASKLTEY